MRKTLSILLATLGMAYSSSAATINHDYVTSITPANQQKGQGSYHGFAVNLNSNITCSTTQNGINSNLPLDTPLSLSNITLLNREGNQANIKLAIYEYNGDGTLGSFVGLSSTTTSVSGSTLSFDFDSAILTQGNATYQFMFVNDTATSESLNLTDAQARVEAYQSVSTSAQIQVQQGFSNNIPGGSGTYKNNTMNGWEGQYLPIASITTASIPEPSTATLGLLGLGTLMLRRRRRV